MIDMEKVKKWQKNIQDALEGQNDVNTWNFFRRNEEDISIRNQKFMEAIVYSDYYQLLDSRGLLNLGFCPITGDEIDNSFYYTCFGNKIYLSETGFTLANGAKYLEKGVNICISLYELKMKNTIENNIEKHTQKQTLKNKVKSFFLGINKEEAIIVSILIGIIASIFSGYFLTHTLFNDSTSNVIGFKVTDKYGNVRTQKHVFNYIIGTTNFVFFSLLSYLLIKNRNGNTTR